MIKQLAGVQGVVKVYIHLSEVSRFVDTLKVECCHSKVPCFPLHSVDMMLISLVEEVG